MVFGKWIHFELVFLREILPWFEGLKGHGHRQYLEVLQSVRQIARVHWGYFMEDARWGSRIKREKLPVDFKFRLSRELGKIRRPMVKYHEEMESQTVVGSQISQKPVAHN